MHRLTKALLGSTCLTALSAGAVQAGILTVPDFGDAQAFATDVTGAAYLTGRIDGTAEASASGSASGSSGTAGDSADYFSYTLSAGQTLRFLLTPAAEASSTGEDRVAFPDPGPSGIQPGTLTAPVGSGVLDPVFSQLALEFLVEASAAASGSSSSPSPSPDFGLLPDGDGNLYGSYEALTDQTVVFGLSGYGGSPHLDYRFDFALESPPAAVPAPGLAAAAMGAAAVSGLGFLRRRKRKR